MPPAPYLEPRAYHGQRSAATAAACVWNAAWKAAHCRRTRPQLGLTFAIAIRRSGIRSLRRSVRPRNVHAEVHAEAPEYRGSAASNNIQEECAHVHMQAMLIVGALALAFAVGAGPSRSGCRPQPRSRAQVRRPSAVTQVQWRVSSATARRGWGRGAVARPGRRRRDRQHHRQRGLSAAARLLLRRLCLRRPLLLSLRLSAATRARSARRTSARSSGVRASTPPTRARSGSAPT